MSLHQTFVHCGRFSAAASRRSLGRISVPMWPVTLSGRLPIVALVGHYPTNRLIGRRLIVKRKNFPLLYLCSKSICGISPCFHGLSPTSRQITLSSCPNKPARLACLRRIANVRSEPESNSPYSLFSESFSILYFITLLSDDLLFAKKLLLIVTRLGLRT